MAARRQAGRRSAGEVVRVASWMPRSWNGSDVPRGSIALLRPAKRSKQQAQIRKTTAQEFENPAREEFAPFIGPRLRMRTSVNWPNFASPWDDWCFTLDRVRFLFSRRLC